MALLLFFWAIRLPSLDAFPLHVDEGVYLARATQVWNGHPFWEISDGRIINHWLIAAFYPPGGSAPAFVGRYGTVLVAMVGLSAGFALAGRLWGRRAAVFAWVMWLVSPYLFFFERTALCDAQPGALVVLTLWACVRLAGYGRHRDAVLTGLALSLAALYKFSAAPFALMVLLVVALMGRVSWRRRLVNLAIIGAVGLAFFAVPLAYMVLRGKDFAPAFGALGVRPGGELILQQFAENLELLWDLLWAWGYMLPILVGWIALVRFAPARRGVTLLFAGGVPLVIIMALGKRIYPRNYVVALPLMLTLAGAGIGLALDRLDAWWHDKMLGGRKATSWVSGLLIAILLTVPAEEFFITAYRDYGELPLPARVREQYVAGHSAGFGLREAVQAFPETITPPSAPVIASMFSDSCHRANFYGAHGFDMVCADAPGLDAINAALETHGSVYVLVEAPPIGIDINTLDVEAHRIAGYPRPGEVEDGASVVLWRLDANP